MILTQPAGLRARAREAKRTERLHPALVSCPGLSLGSLLFVRLTGSVGVGDAGGARQGSHLHHQPLLPVRTAQAKPIDAPRITNPVPGRGLSISYWRFAVAKWSDSLLSCLPVCPSATKVQA